MGWKRGPRTRECGPKRVRPAPLEQNGRISSDPCGDYDVAESVGCRQECAASLLFWSGFHEEFYRGDSTVRDSVSIDDRDLDVVLDTDVVSSDSLPDSPREAE